MKFDATGRATRNTWLNGGGAFGERPTGEFWSLADLRVDPRNPWKHAEELKTHGSTLRIRSLNDGNAIPINTETRLLDVHANRT